MPNTETTHLVSMANDIAANLSFQGDAADKIADHINRFWVGKDKPIYWHDISRLARKPTLRTALSIDPDQPKHAAQAYLRLIWIFCFRNHDSIPLSPDQSSRTAQADLGRYITHSVGILAGINYLMN